MERSEPALVPEWLKGANGGISGGGSTAHHFASSSQSDDHSVVLPARKRSSVSSSDHDTPRSSLMDRTSSSYFRRSSSSNGALVHDKEPSAYSRSYSSFNRSHRDKDWEKGLDYREERLLSGNHRDRDYSDSLTDIRTSRIEKDTLRRSQSMISGKRVDVWPKRVGNDTNNGQLVGGSIVSNIHKASFERDFPSLGAEEKQGVPDICRVSSPGLSTASQSLPICSSTVIGGDGWTSALAEVPVMISSNSPILSSIQQSAPASLATVPPSTTTGLNMAETLAQAPSRARSVPQLSVETQRLEELAIKQSRQLIPMTPSVPKTSVLNSSDKLKPKASRIGELGNVSKVGQQPSSPQLVNHALRGPARLDVPKTSQAGKLLVLKPAREKNGLSPTVKDSQSPTNTNRASLGVGPFAPSRNPNPNSNAPKLSTDHRKAPALPVTQSSSMDKRPPSQAQNRSDFFKSLRKKTENLSAAIPDSCPIMSSVLEKSDEQIPVSDATVSEGKDVNDPVLDCSTGNESNMAGNGDSFSGNGEKKYGSDAIVCTDEEEAAFLRSLGWEEPEENAGEEEEALTEEEINAFYECIKLRPASKLFQGMQKSKIALLLESHTGNGASSGCTSSNSAP
ncbi:uncharacterized protein LOC143857897 [Tasmannia lanceolata]|uniref:uncharacterized protein LOC143857897 n=1 Tax=Tasmannia lanceolata TaxID=3420 RepID=UPI004063F684